MALGGKWFCGLSGAGQTRKPLFRSSRPPGILVARVSRARSVPASASMAVASWERVRPLAQRSPAGDYRPRSPPVRSSRHMRAARQRPTAPDASRRVQGCLRARGRAGRRPVHEPPEAHALSVMRTMSNPRAGPSLRTARRQVSRTTDAAGYALRTPDLPRPHVPRAAHHRQRQMQGLRVLRPGVRRGQTPPPSATLGDPRSYQTRTSR
jgi:hypothetical protein